MRIFTFVSICLILHSCLLFGQIGSDYPLNNKLLSALPTETQYPVSLYKEATRESQNLYNGRVYYIYDNRMEEHQFFESRKWDKGLVIFEGQRFDSVQTLYDIVRDELVIRHMNGEAIILPSEKVQYFFNNRQLFKWFEAGKGIEPQMRSGFYNVFYDGPTQLLIRRMKFREEKIKDKSVITLFPQKDSYYIRKNDHYVSVRTKKSVLRLFAEHKGSLRRVLREEGIQYRSDRAKAIGRMVETYDSLAKP
jgi:hypothetical protein